MRHFPLPGQSMNTWERWSASELNDLWSDLTGSSDLDRAELLLLLWRAYSRDHAASIFGTSCVWTQAKRSSDYLTSKNRIFDTRLWVPRTSPLQAEHDYDFAFVVRLAHEMLKGHGADLGRREQQEPDPTPESPPAAPLTVTPVSEEPTSVAARAAYYRERLARTVHLLGNDATSGVAYQRAMRGRDEAEE